MNLQQELKNNSKEFLREIKDADSLEASILSVVNLGFTNFNAPKLSDLNRKYGSQCRKYADTSVKEFIGRMVDSDLVLVIAGSRNNFRVVPAGLWLDVYEFAVADSESAVQNLMNKYINIEG